MGTCAICGEKNKPGYTCAYCGEAHCVTHRLPEDHDCRNLHEAKAPRTQSASSAKKGTQQKVSRESETESELTQEKWKRQRPEPKPMETVRTYGGSGRDRSKAKFSKSPDVGVDGSVKGPETEPIEPEYATVNETDWKNRLRYVLKIAGIALAAILVLYFYRQVPL